MHSNGDRRHVSSSEIVNPFFDERDVRWANTNFTALRNAKHLINLACLLLPITAQYTAFFKQKCAATFFAVRRKAPANRPIQCFSVFTQAVINATASVWPM